MHVKKTVDYYFRIISQAGIKCSKFPNDDNKLLTIENVHITTFKSAKGLEFDTVIMPDFQYFKMNIAQLDVITENEIGRAHV